MVCLQVGGMSRVPIMPRFAATLAREHVLLLIRAPLTGGGTSFCNPQVPSGALLTTSHLLWQEVLHQLLI